MRANTGVKAFCQDLTIQWKAPSCPVAQRSRWPEGGERYPLRAWITRRCHSIFPDTKKIAPVKYLQTFYTDLNGLICKIKVTV
jgi:hypothetical protein